MTSHLSPTGSGRPPGAGTAATSFAPPRPGAGR